MTYPDRTKILVGLATCGLSAGAGKVYQALQEEIKNTGADLMVEKTGCIGYCQREPLVDVIQPGHPRLTYERMTPERAGELIRCLVRGGLYTEGVLCRIDQDEWLIENSFRKYSGNGLPPGYEKFPAYQEIPFFKKQRKIALRTCGFINPEHIEEYIGRGGYKALYQALRQMNPEDVIAEVKMSGLRGRGGAGFSTGLKWEFCRQAAGEMKYVICNADEGDPGAFMDRSILEGDPHAVIEGMAIGAYAMGAREGYLYVRAEYPLAIEHLKIAIGQAEAYGLLGENIFGTPFSFRLKIREGAGAFVCGEETALIASIEGQVGEPRPRPPFPAQKGLWGCPTNINNVKTWSHIAPIIARGAEWYSGMGTEKAPGTTVFSLVGKVKNTGLVEIPLGIPLQEMIYDIGGGTQGDRPLKAVQTGGPSGGCIPVEHLQTPVEYESLAALGSIMGSGGMIVMDEGTCMVDLAKYFISFTMEESCGKCTPCREGTKRLMEILTDISRGEARESDLTALEELALYVKEVSLCGLGGTAPNPILTTLRYFRDEYLAHIVDKQCPARVCKRLSPAPCQFACPAGIDVPSYVALIGEGRFEEALTLIREDNPLPAVCGYVCPAPCETQCRRGEIDQAVSIKSLKRFVADFVRTRREQPPENAIHRREKIAVIGSGPAGLTAAYYLAWEGYPVTVFESLSEIGGMLRVGIPAYRLPREVLDFDVQAIARMGVVFQTKTRVGRDVTFDELQKQGFKAFFLGTGAHQEVRLNIPGEELPGVLSGIEFLRQISLGQPVSPGKNIAVVGGGNVAMDAARTARRLGARVTVLYRRTEAEIPAYPEEIAQALAEGIEIRYLTQPVEISGKGAMQAVKCLSMELGEPDASGRRRPVPLAGSEFTLEVDGVIKAIGQLPETLECSREGQPLQVRSRGTVEVRSFHLATNLTGFFAGGDNVTGPASVVEAVAAGKQAARSIHRHLQDQALEEKPRIPTPRKRLEPLVVPDEEQAGLTRPAMPEAPVEVRVRDFTPVELGFDQKQAQNEAKRCLRCDWGD
ncbi:MAG: FAD-dependent oxidoreductase [Deltaproteobacteria bacterium]|nr:FAD-dependent oxidoreductase [Deltaproteobacteria bacterium]